MIFRGSMAMPSVGMLQRFYVLLYLLRVQSQGSRVLGFTLYEIRIKVPRL